MIAGRILLLVSTLAVACAEVPDQVQLEITISASETCVNPSLGAGGSRWETHDKIPRRWFEAGPIVGTLAIEGDSGEFVTDFGKVLQYDRNDGFSDHPCLIA